MLLPVAAGLSLVADATIKASHATASDAASVSTSGAVPARDAESDAAAAAAVDRPTRGLTINPAACASDSALDKLAALDARALGLTQVPSSPVRSRFAAAAQVAPDEESQSQAESQQEQRGGWGWGNKGGQRLTPAITSG